MNKRALTKNPTQPRIYIPDRKGLKEEERKVLCGYFCVDVC